MTSQNLHTELIKHFSSDVAKLTDEQLTAYAGGWSNHLPMAILDAIYSIQTRYTTKHGKGLLPRLKTFKETHPEAAQDLRELLKLSTADIEAILGRGKTSGTSKAQAALQVAKNLTELAPPVYTAQDFNYVNAEHERAYSSVHGLGNVTYRYLSMLLGHGDVKPDTWIIRAVQRVADTHQLDLRITSDLARHIVTETHKATGCGETVTHLDHAIWLNERTSDEN
ncbi:hypothetical protein [Glutamicibacter sp. MCAF14]|uniref:hypothetical protein n=1 Tax=Glutamicibacter sp. MCAF14 TaxID=3233043 RepID=UPI003F922A17